MHINELLSDLNERFPFANAASWDPVGIQIGGPGRSADRIGVCHEPNEDVVGAAVAAGLDTLVSYHPLLFAPTTRLIDGPTASGRTLRLAAAGISLVVVHTALDAAHPGTGDHFLASLGFRSTGRWGSEDGDPSTAIGRLAHLDDPIDATELTERVVAAIGMPIQSTSIEGAINTVAVLPGSGGQFIEDTIGLADALITGDVSHHRARDAADAGLMVIDAGHTSTEQAGIQALYSAVCDTDEDAVFVGGNPTPWAMPGEG